MTTCLCCTGPAKKFGRFQNRNLTVQRYRCTVCGKCFSEPQPLDHLRVSHDKVIQIVKLLTEGMGIPADALGGFHSMAPSVGQLRESMADNIKNLNRGLAMSRLA